MLAIEKLQHDLAIVNGRLVRRLVTGTKPTGYCVSGSWMVSVGGKLFPMASVAWALIYGTWPPIPVQNLAPDQQDLWPEDLVPVVERRYRYCVSERTGAYRHSLSESEFLSDVECRADWQRCVRNLTADAKKRILGLSMASSPVPVDVVEPKRYRPATRPEKPSDVPGRVWYFYSGSWRSLPESIHPSDDMQLRAEAFAAGAVRMEMRDGKCVPVFAN